MIFLTISRENEEKLLNMKADVDRLVQKEHKLAKGVLYILDLKSYKITLFKVFENKRRK